MPSRFGVSYRSDWFLLTRPIPDYMLLYPKGRQGNVELIRFSFAQSSIEESYACYYARRDFI